MKADINSPYIKQFLGKDNSALIDAMDKHQNHQSPLDPLQEKLEGSTTPYSIKDKKFYGRR